MAEKTTIARPYAQALFELASAQKDLKGWSEMLQFAAAVVSNEQLRALIGNPRVRPRQLTNLVLEVCGDKLNAAGRNFIKLLIENRRLNVLPEIAQLYEAQRAEAEGTLQAEVVSAYELSAEQQQKIASALQARLGRKISLSNSVDKGLLGGVIIRAGDRVIDGSARGQIARLASVLAR
ncbi:MAG: F0F1 ATP synthase subunit delta [Pseudomonadota bacterium]